jgi:kynurenine formamidase
LILEEFAMKYVTVLAGILAIIPVSASAQDWSPPAETTRCPSKWGAGDERGSANLVTAKSVLEAAKLVRTGEMIELGHILRNSIPMVGTRRFDLHTKRTFMNNQPNQRGSNEEIVTTELAQVGTQLDGFPHQTHGDSLYNCFKVSELASRSGFSKLGIEKVGTLAARGVLIDVAALKSVETLPDNYEITVQDLQQALAKQGTKLQPGDAIAVNTGWGRLWEKENARFNKSNPGLGIAAAQWLIEQTPLLLGADTATVEVMPNPNPQLSLPVHQIALVVNGVYLLENLKLEELAAKRAYEFMFVMQPLKIQGGTGSTVAPVAIR